MRVFLDANLLFTAALSPAGTVARLISEGSRAGWQWVTSDYAVHEAKRNLRRKAPESMDRFEALLGFMTTVPATASEPCPVALPGKDRPILAGAIQSGCDYLLTGDVKDFGVHMDQPKRTGGVRILTVALFIDRLFKD